MLPTARPEAVGLCPERLARLDAVLLGEVERQKLPGAVVMVSRRGQVVHLKAHGRLDPRRDAPMQTDSIFRIYSMTKPIVSVAAMMLVEQGRLLLRQPIETLLPEFAAVQVAGGKRNDTGVPPARSIFVHDLLRHTAGFAYGDMGETLTHQAYRSAGLFEPGLSSAGFTQKLARLPLLFQPGTAWSYGHATDVLGRLVEVVTGQSLGEHLQQVVFSPLGMVDTAFHADAARLHRVAEPFATDPDSGTAVRLSDVRTPPANEMGGAGLVSTAPDYARFLQMLLDGGALGGVRLLGPKTVRLMTCDHLGGLPAVDGLLGPGQGFGLGFGVRLQDGIVPQAGTAGQYGWSGHAGTSFFVDPKEQLHAQLMIQQPGRLDHYRQLFRELVYAALLD